MRPRRRFLVSLGLSVIATYGCSRMTAKDIQELPREYALLKDATMRRAEMGDQILKISGVDFSDGFYDAEWENIHFHDCIFYGRIPLKLLRHCTFEHCQFPGSNFQSYWMENVLFFRSDTIGVTYIMAGNDSKNVRFVECDFGGRDSNRNHYGAIYFHGDVSFEKCTGQYMDISGDGIISYISCKFGSIDLQNGSLEDGKKTRATVMFDGCIFKKDTKLSVGNLTSLTIRNSSFGVLDIGGTDVEGDVLIENVQAGAMITAFGNARSITIRNSRFRGINVNADNGYPSLYRALDCFVSLEKRASLRSVVLENVECGRDDNSAPDEAKNLLDEKVSGSWIMGGEDTTIIRNCTIPKATYWLNSANVLIDNLNGEKASFVTSHIGSLTFRNTGIVKAIDFSGVQVKKLDAKGLVRYTGQKIVTEGSNLSL